jgi:hypothetical protein
MKQELFDEIDLLIKELVKNRVISRAGSITELKKNAFSFLERNNIIKPNNKPLQFNQTSKIDEIKNIGIEKYLSNKETNKNIDSAIKQRTLFDLKNKYFINFCFLVFGALFGWFLANISESNKEKGNTEKLNKVISKKNDSLIQKQILLKEKNKIIHSLKNELDSLKTKTN